MKTNAHYWTVFRRMLASAIMLVPAVITAQTYVYIAGTPNYEWHAGCFGTASGNLAGYWDRHGFPDIYTGPINGGLAPLNSQGANYGIRGMWASEAGVDGRPGNKPGHMDDYYERYEYTGPDRYVTLGRAEHAPDCTGDFIGLSQNKWTNLNSECRGNIDAYSFVYWDKTGHPRSNYYTTNAAGVYIPDIGSGLREWARWRGYDVDVLTQLSSFNPERTTTNGFTYDDVRREIMAGYPVLCFLQPTAQFARNPSTGATTTNSSGMNPDIHGVMVYGIYEDPSSGYEGVVIRTSWATGGDAVIDSWTLDNWLGLPVVDGSPFAVRGVITFHPKPRVRTITRAPGTVSLAWDGPASQLYDVSTGQTTDVSHYTVQRATRLTPPDWKNVTTASTNRTATIPENSGTNAFYRVVLAAP